MPSGGARDQGHVAALQAQFVSWNSSIYCMFFLMPLSLLCSYKDTAEHIDKMNEMYDFVEGYESKFDGGDSSQVFPMSDRYFDYITMEIITTELVRNILLALACVFLATLFLIADILASIIVVVSVFLALIDLGGFMYFWGLSIDTIVSILVTIALGLSVDYSAHVAHAFMVATGTRYGKDC